MNWKDYYNLAKAYYEKHGNLEVRYKFRTINGYEEDIDGVALGRWISKQRSTFNGKTKDTTLTEEQIKLLTEIGMRFENIDLMDNWMKMYNLAKAYYEKHGSLEVTYSFKTTNGYEFDEKGVVLLSWINNQRQTYKGRGSNKPLTEKQIKLLTEIGMRFEDIDLMDKWMKMYNLAKAYYEKYGNLEVPYSFITINGYEEAENGEALGTWISRQRNRFKGRKGCTPLTEEQIKLLIEIDMRFEDIDLMDKWMKMYNLAKSYHEKNGNLEVPYSFKTINGYEKAENGESLGTWISRQRNRFKGRKGCTPLIEEQIKLLTEIGIRFEDIDLMDNWMKKYNLAKVYYEKNGNLEVPQNFKTMNGYEKDRKGVKLGTWIAAQRQTYKGQNTNNPLTEEQIKLLTEIGMRFENIDLMDNWMKKYNLAKAYYEKNGDLEVPQTFKTINGYKKDRKGTTLGTWINTQRLAYKGKNKKIHLTEEQIKLLDDIKMIWISAKTDEKLQSELITKENISKKKIEMLNRFRTYLNSLDNETLPSKEELNKGFMKQLNKNIKK